MRIFKTFTEAYHEVERDLYEMGILVHPKTWQNRNVIGRTEFDCKEIRGYGFKITNPINGLEFLEELQLNFQWTKMEFQERVSEESINPGQAYKLNREFWQKFLNNRGKFHYTYNQRIENQLFGIVQLLRKDPDTRRAILNIYDRQMDGPRIDMPFRIPCSMYYHFLIRLNYVEMIYTMRSCDFANHFPYDIVLASMLQEYVAKQLDLSVGTLTVFIDSLHIFKKDWKDGIF